MTQEEQALRLQRCREQHSHRRAQETHKEQVRLQQQRNQYSREENPLHLEDPVVRAKMCKSHTHLAELQFVYYATCEESFPSLRLRTNSTECLRCARDTKTLNYTLTPTTWILALFHHNYRYYFDNYIWLLNKHYTIALIC